jgi:hypothetical protein
VYRSLDPDKIIETLDALNSRISDRFPGSGLGNVCAEVVGLARRTSRRIADVSQPIWGLRIALLGLLAAVVAVIAMLAVEWSALKTSDELTETMQGVDAGVNLLIVLGGAAFFLASLETRWKRDRALKALHELRSIIHVIDMHQLTKDPSMLGQIRTSSSPDRPLTPFMLIRYLDYCSELLSLTAKCAALYAEKLSDPVVIDTVGNIELLTSDLSSKIWQKITIVEGLNADHTPLPTAEPKDASGREPDAHEA